MGFFRGGTLSYGGELRDLPQGLHLIDHRSKIALCDRLSHRRIFTPERFAMSDRCNSFPVEWEYTYVFALKPQKVRDDPRTIEARLSPKGPKMAIFDP